MLAGSLPFDEKSAKLFHKPPSQPVRETPDRPFNMKCMVPAFLGDQFGGKEGGLGLGTELRSEKIPWNYFFVGNSQPYGLAHLQASSQDVGDIMSSGLGY